MSKYFAKVLLVFKSRGLSFPSENAYGLLFFNLGWLYKQYNYCQSGIWAFAKFMDNSFWCARVCVVYQNIENGLLRRESLSKRGPLSTLFSQAGNILYLTNGTRLDQAP